jgi:hypothetical protein
MAVKPPEIASYKTRSGRKGRNLKSQRWLTENSGVSALAAVSSLSYTPRKVRVMRWIVKEIMLVATGHDAYLHLACG